MKAKGWLLAILAALPSAALSADFSNDEICKAAIALEMARPTDIMQTVRSGDMPQIRYTRPGGDSFLFRCKVQTERVIWATYFDETGGWGRWRDAADDGVISFTVSGGTLEVSSSLTGIAKSFAKEDF